MAFRHAFCRMRYASCGRFRKPPQAPVFCVGNFRTGAISLANLLRTRLRVAHEPDGYTFLRTLLARYQGRLEADDMDRFLIRRTCALNLDCEVSGFLPFVAADLHRLFPQARFILPLRDPLVWADYLLRDIIDVRRRFGWHFWDPVFAYWFGGEDRTRFEPEERLLEELDLFPLRHVFAHWYLSNQLVFNSIDRERLLVLRIDDLSDSLHQLEKFVGLEPGILTSDGLHTEWTPPGEQILAQLDATWVAEALRKAREMVLDNGGTIPPWAEYD